MRRDAESFASEDSQRKEDAETRNAADSLVYTAEKTIRDHGDKLPAEMKQEIETKAAALQEAVKTQDGASIKSSMQDLSDTLQKAGSAVYGQQEQPGTAEGAPEEQGGDDGSVEGDFREV